MRPPTRLPLAAALIASSGAFVALGALPAEAATCTDTYAAGGGSWATAASWSSGLPTSTDVVCWATGDTVTYSTTTPALTTVTAIGTSTHPAGTLVVTAGELNMTGQGATGSFISALTSTSIIGTARAGLGATTPVGPFGDLTISGDVALGTSSTFSIGSVTQTGGVLSTTGYGPSLYGTTYTDTSSSVATLADQSSISLQEPDTSHPASVTLPGVVMGDHTAIDVYGTATGETATITGPLTKTESNGAYTDHLATIEPPLTFSGDASVDVSSGNLQLNSVTDDVSGGTVMTSTSNGAEGLWLTPGSATGTYGTITGSGTVTLANGGTAAVPNTIAHLTAANPSVTGGFWKVTGTLATTGTLAVNGQLQPPATSTVNNLTISGNFGVLGVNGVSTVDPVGAVTIDGDLDFQGGSLSTATATQAAGQSIILNSGTSGEGSIYGGLLTSPDSFTMPSGKSFALASPDAGHQGSISLSNLTLGENATFGAGSNPGTTTVIGTFSAPYDGSAGNHISSMNSPLVLSGGASGSITGSGAQLSLGRGMTIAAGASFSTDAGTTLVSQGQPVVNSGAATIGGSTSSGTLWHQEAGSLTLPATTGLALTNDGGTLHLPSAVGAVSVLSYTQSATGTLPIRVSGDATLDSLTVTGSTAPVVHGAIHVTDPGGFSPALGDDFDLITCAGCNTTPLTSDATVTDDLSGTVHYGVQGLAKKLQLYVKGVPSAPVITAVDGITKSGARVTFTGASANGSPVSDYVFTCSPACPSQHTGSATIAPFTLTGLSPATTYSVTAHAVNGNGQSSESNGKTFSTIDVPQPPTGTLATPADGQITVSFTPPASTGGSPVTTYTVQAVCGGVTHNVNGASSPIVVPGLTDGTLCVVTVTATNAAGSSSASITSTATPDGPAKPVVVTGTAPKPQTLQVSFKQATGGARTTSYTATCVQVGGTSRGSATGPSSPLTITGLLNNTNYSCSVHGTSEQGVGAESNAVIGRPGRLPTVTATITVKGKKVTKVKAGTTLTIKVVGTVADKPAARRTVILIFQRSGKKTGTTVATRTTDSKGRATFTVTFKKAGSYEVQLPLGPSAPHSKLQTVKRAV